MVFHKVMLGRRLSFEARNVVGDSVSLALAMARLRLL